MVYQVSSYSTMFIQCTGNLQLGAHPVGAGDDDGLLITLQLKETTKKTEVAKDLGFERRTRLFAYRLYYFIGSINVHTCVTIGFSLCIQELPLE